MITPPAQNNNICKFCEDDGCVTVAVRKILEPIFGRDLVWSCQECIDILECEDGEQQIALVSAQAERREAFENEEEVESWLCGECQSYFHATKAIYEERYCCDKCWEKAE